MITAQNANSAAITAINDLTFIDSSVTAASNQGLYQIFVDGNKMDDDMMSDLIENYGYKVDKRFYDMGTYPTYVISWS
jgi:hypothetical protein